MRILSLALETGLIAVVMSKPNQESIFVGPGHWSLSAGVNYPNNSHELMTEGYLRAAQQLVESLENQSRGADFLVYPVVYLYRHWFELRLKDIINLGRRLLREGHGYPTGHGLHNLWPIAKRLIGEVWSESERPEQFDLIDAAVAEFGIFDASSQAFRYPVDNKGNALRQGLREVNLEHFSRKMEEIAEFLDAASMGMSVYLDNMYDGTY
jgi:hypothetical protein